MASTELRGLGIALATPFRDDFSVDYQALGEIIDYQIASGAHYLVSLATTSEAVTLTLPERHEVAAFVRSRVASRVPLVIGMSGNCTAEVVSHIQGADLAGYCAILSVVPYYNKPSQEGIYRHFKAIAEASPLPIILYNVPSRTGVNMTADTTLRLAREFPGKITAIKEASGNVDQIADIIARKPEGFTVLSGDDGLTLRLISLGAEGVISVLGNGLTRLCSTMVSEALINPASPRAAAIDQAIQPMCAALFAEGNPSGLKSLLCNLGLSADVLRLPLVPVSPATSTSIARQTTVLRTLFPDLMPPARH